MLHILSRSPYATDCLRHCLPLLGAGDTLLLIEDAVYALADASLFQTLSQNTEQAVCVLIADVQARGLARQAKASGCRMTDYAGFVALTVAHRHIQSW